jgi:hypothetical protein
MALTEGIVVIPACSYCYPCRLPVTEQAAEMKQSAVVHLVATLVIHVVFSYHLVQLLVHTHVMLH